MAKKAAKEPHPGHNQHLCYLLISHDQEGNASPNIDAIKPLVKDAKFICGQCGRVAAKKENLCDAKPL